MTLSDEWDAGDGGDGVEVMFVTSVPEDARIVSTVFEQQSVSLEVAPDGRAALAWLTARSDGESPNQLPELVVLDADIEPIDGTTVLDAIKSSPRLGTLPVVVLTDDPLEAETAYELGANAHVTKPADAETCADLAELLAQFWFDWAKRPSEPLRRSKPRYEYE